MLNNSPIDSTQRFSDRVENYIRYRPSYPDGILQLLKEKTGLAPTSVIADIGSGTGISAKLFLQNGNPVWGVEPNLNMRQAAEAQLNSFSNFHSVAGTAEATGRPDQSVDYIIAAQAFHWFKQPTAKQEFTRILRSPGWVVLLWNTRRTDSTPFLRAYEALLRQYGTDYETIRHTNIDLKALEAFFPTGAPTHHALYLEQQFSYEGLKGRLLSSSYTPNQDHPRHQPMIQDLWQLFDTYQTQGKIYFEYDTNIFWGQWS